MLPPSTDGVFRIDGEGIVEFVNNRVTAMLGYDPSEIVGKSIYLLIDPKKRDVAKLAFEEQGLPELRFIRKDGSGMDARLSIFPFVGRTKEEKGKAGIYIVVSDITQIRLAEEELRESKDYLENLLNYANAPIIVWDADFKIKIFNRAFERLTGYQFEQVQGRHLELLFPETSRKESLDKILRTLNGEHWETVEMPIMRKDGTVRVALWNSANVYDASGRKLVATIAQGQDITERKHVEQRLIALNESLRDQAIELEAVNRELESFNYSLSHDLRAPLRSIEGFGDMLLERAGDKLDHESRDYVNRMRAASERISHLIDDLQALSSVTRCKMRWERVDLSSMAREIAVDLKKAHPDQDVDLEIESGTSVEGDARLLKVMLGNILDNAWKFTSRVQHPRIQFGITYINNKKAFFVRDNGTGFDMAYYDKLFAPFQRLHSAKEYPGTGIGLVTAQRIMRRHGGKIWGEGAVGQGATFYFAFGEGRSEPTSKELAR